MRQALRAGLAYFAVVFAMGFALGTLRVLVMERWLGTTGAVLVELPVMLAVSWAAMQAVTAYCRVPPAWTPRLSMGVVAFALLMLAEAALSVLLLGRTPAEHVARYAQTPEQLGLIAQVLFALMPALDLITARARGRG